MASPKPFDIQYGLSLNGSLVLDRERNLAVENASIKNLQVTGTITAVNSTNTYIKDNNILLNSGIEAGAITTLGSITGGNNYTEGSYRNIPLVVSSGATGYGATADITVNSSGAVSVVTIVNGGHGYSTDTVFSVASSDIDSTLTAGSGFEVPVTAVTAGSASTDAFITVARGTTGADVAIKWDETTSDRWQLTNNGTNYYNIYTTNDASVTAVASTLVIRDESGNINANNLGVTDGTFSGDIAVNGGDITTTSTGTVTLFNTNATGLNLGGAATTVTLANTGTAARTVDIATAATAGASTLIFGGSVSGNILKIASTTAGAVNVTTDVTTGTANVFTSLTSGTLNLATGGASTTNIGGTGGSLTIGTVSGNSTLTINGNSAAGTSTLTTNVTTGTVDVFAGLTTGTLNLATSGASVTNIGGAAGNVNIGATSGNSILTIRGNGTAGTTTVATNVTSGTANIFTSVTGTLNLATAGASETNVGGAGASLNVGTTSGNSTLSVRGNGVSGTATVSTNVTAGTVDAFVGLSTGTLNLATGGASTTNIGGAAGNVNIGTTSGNSTLTVRGNGTGGTATVSTNVTTGIADIFTSVTGRLNIGGLSSSIYFGTQSAVSATTTTVATTTQTATDAFSASTFRSCEYLVQITQGSSYQISKVLLTHDGSSVYITEYGTVTTGSILGTLDADISSGNVRLLVTMGAATSATVKVTKTTIVV